MKARRALGSLVAGGMSFGLHSCADKPTMPAQQSIVDGDWLSPCLPGQYGFAAYQVRLFFRETHKITREVVSFEDSGCRQPAFVEHLEGRYELSLAPREDEYKIDLYFTAFEDLALTEKAQQNLLDQHYCGLERWQVGALYDVALVTREPCRSLGVLPIVNWNRVEVKPRASLRFAAELEHDNQRPDRFVSEDPSLHFQQQVEAVLPLVQKD